MSIFDKSMSQLAEADVRELLDENAVENAPRKVEVLKKLPSFANTFGGYIVIGAEADSEDVPMHAQGGENESQRSPSWNSAVSLRG